MNKRETAVICKREKEVRERFSSGRETSFPFPPPFFFLYVVYCIKSLPSCRGNYFTCYTVVANRDVREHDMPVPMNSSLISRQREGNLFFSRFYLGIFWANGTKKNYPSFFLESFKCHSPQSGKKELLANLHLIEKGWIPQPITDAN